MEEVNNETMRKQGYCPIEKKIMPFRKLPNKKWICEGGGCSGAAGQYKGIPKSPKNRRK